MNRPQGNPVRPRIPNLFIALGALLFAVAAPAADRAAHDSPPACPVGDCGIAGIQPYDAIVVGHPRKVLSDDEMRALYQWARTRTWRDFADSEADYLERNRVVLLPTGVEGKDVLVHMARVDYDAASYVAGALIRYTPRSMPDTYYPDGRPIHSSLAGCVALLCAADDAACLKEYPRGLFRRQDGVELDPRDETHKTPLAHGRVIDPVSMRVKTETRARVKQ
jgi:hypothetical protein